MLEVNRREAQKVMPNKVRASDASGYITCGNDDGVCFHGLLARPHLEGSS